MDVFRQDKVATLSAKKLGHGDMLYWAVFALLFKNEINDCRHINALSGLKKLSHFHAFSTSLARKSGVDEKNLESIMYKKPAQFSHQHFLPEKRDETAFS